MYPGEVGGEPSATTTSTTTSTTTTSTTSTTVTTTTHVTERCDESDLDPNAYNNGHWDCTNNEERRLRGLYQYC